MEIVSQDQKVYLCFRKRVQSYPNEVLKVRDVCHFFSGEGDITVGELPLGQVAKNAKHAVVEALDVIRQIQSYSPGKEVEFLGGTQILVEQIEADLSKAKQKKSPPRYLILALIWILVFCGSGLAIMYFHVDAGMREVHIRIHQLLTGEVTDQPLWLSIPYSLGVGLGMLLFFNRGFLGRKKSKERDPSPLEVESLQYRNKLDQYVMDRSHIHKLDRAVAEISEGQDPSNNSLDEGHSS